MEGGRLLATRGEVGQLERDRERGEALGFEADPESVRLRLRRFHRHLENAGSVALLTNRPRSDRFPRDRDDLVGPAQTEAVARALSLEFRDVDRRLGDDAVAVDRRRAIDDDAVKQGRLGSVATHIDDDAAGFVFDGRRGILSGHGKGDHAEEEVKRVGSWTHEAKVGQRFGLAVEGKRTRSRPQ